MGVSTRPSYIHRQQRRNTSSALAVFLFVFGASPALAAASPDIPDVEATQSIAQDIAHEVAISVVEPGKETLSVSARLTTMSVQIARDVKWQVRNEAGELVLDTTSNELESRLAPGSYTVEAQYGAVAVRETVRVIDGSSVAVSFILNAGGLRVLPALKGISSAELPSKTLVYALGGIDKGKLIAHTEQPGEMLKLPAGLYRVESRIGDGNTSAVTDVRVRPGKISAVEVSHQAGLARLNFVGSPESHVTWDIRPIDGRKIASLEGLTHKLALKPGTYLAEAHVNGEILTAKFNIVVGEERDIMLGN
jgi:hypothetical protein